jgi:predicted SAM-dependent methyltransferase
MLQFNKLNLGSGYRYRRGYFNIDIHAANYICEDFAILRWTAPEELPFQDGSMSFTYSSHFFEHLYHEEAMLVLHDLFRVTAVGGRLSIALPNAEELIRAYVEDDQRVLAKWKSEKPQSQRTCPTFKPQMIHHNRHPDLIKALEIDPQYLGIHNLARSLADITEVRLRATKPAHEEQLSSIDLISHLLHQSEHHQLYDQKKIITQCTNAGFSAVGSRQYDQSIDEDDLKHISFYVDFVKP